MEMEGSENDNEDRSCVFQRSNATLVQKSKAAIQLVVSAAFELHLNIPRWGNVARFNEESGFASIVRLGRGSHVDVRKGDDPRDSLSVLYSHIVLQLWLIIVPKRLLSLRRVFKSRSGL